MFFIDLLKGINFTYIAILLVLLNGTGILIPVPFAIMRAMEQSRKYLTLSLFGLVIAIVFTFLLVVFVRRNVLGVMEARLLTSIGMILLVVPYLCRNTRIVFHFKEAKELLKFGIPLIPTLLSLWVLDLSDRFFLQYFRGLSEVGIYSLGYKYASIVSLPIVAFSLAWPQVLLSIAKRPDARKTVGRIFTYFILVTTFMALSLSIFSKDIIRMVSTAEFHDAYRIVWYVALGYVFYGGYIFASSGIYISGKSGSLPVAVGIAAVLNIGLNYLFIPHFGMTGAACATLISYIIMCLVMWYLSKGNYPISFEFLRLIKVIIGAAIVYSCSSMFLTGNTAVTLIFKALSIPGYIVLLFIFRFFNAEEIDYMMGKAQDFINKTSRNRR
jgi:O-antigen/teichoic acid export membrane protein